jgi:hypothetical protein
MPAKNVAMSRNQQLRTKSRSECKQSIDRITLLIICYEAVNRSLDLTIDLVGRQQLVEDGVRQFRQIQALAQGECLSNAIFSCNANDAFQQEYEEDEYEKDWVCGYRCADKSWTRNVNPIIFASSRNIFPTFQRGGTILSTMASPLRTRLCD